MKLYSVILIAITLFISCENAAHKEGEYVYFGGEIINPSNNYVTLNNRFTGTDTIYLDENNRFLHKISDIKPGLYSFTHGGEFQMIVLEENDSLLFRLNTNDFDESLVFTGQGSKKNNYLIKSFLKDEEENKKFMKLHQLEPEAFITHMDELKERKIKYLDEFLEKIPSSKIFTNIAKSSIDYNHYAYHEMYPFGYYGNNKLVHVKDLPEDFYDYRADIDLDNENLSELYIYNRFLFWHFNNIALKKYYDNGSHHAFDRMSLDYNIEKLRLIDSSLTSEPIKNYLSKHVTRDFILNSDNQEASVDILDYYLEKSTNTEDKSYLKTLYLASSKLKPGNKIPDTKLIDFDGNTLTLSSLIDKPTVVYCWSSNFKMHYRNSHYMIKNLKSQYPDVNFLAINFNDNKMEYWKNTVKVINYPKDNEYKFKDPSEAIEKYVITFTHKVFIVNKKGEIISSDANLFGEKMKRDLHNLVSTSY
ncbi:redoxin domain-containing protein [uncultured Psychroserpens sp.]|uniref:TlpA family protein disulfide reductase n=1 Tax=uncultured Psychroserpens sp. TaxID=255436 RepID=UPI002618FDFD|nr:redoxin domain-containing protein [uncultured Psychroserpens sp.]